MFLTEDTTKAFQYFQALRLMAAIILGIILVKAGWSQEKVGILEWLLFVVNLGGFFWSMGLKNALLSYFPKIDRPKQEILIFNLTIFFLFLGMILAGVLYFFAKDKIFQAIGHYDSSFWIYTILIFPVGLCEIILLLYQKAKDLVIYGTVTYLSYIIIIWVASQWLEDISVLFSTLCLWIFGRIIYLIYLLYKYQKWKYDHRLLALFVAFSMPFVVHVLLGNGMEFVDGVLVEHFFSEGEFAVFRYGARELPLNTVLITAISTSAIPLAMNHLSRTLQDTKVRLQKLMHILFPLSMVLMIISPLLFEYFFDKNFIYSATIFNIYLLILCSRILLPEIAMYAVGGQKVLMIVSLIELSINIIFSLILMKYFGMAGIAFATIIAYYFQKLGLAYYLSSKHSISLNDYIDTKSYLLYTILLWLVFIGYCMLAC